MTNAHDSLFPTRDRTSALVRQGTYFKYCEQFRHALQLHEQVC
jgi:hypothetical protein